MRIDRVLAPNPGPFTGPGTNTYLVGDDHQVVILDPGPVEDSHRQAILEAVGERRVDSVVVTHTHPDHAPLANPLAASLQVPAVGYAPGPDFDPDLRIGDGDRVTAGEVELLVVHTPGHADDHVCFLADGTLFTGDHIMGGSSVMVDDVAAYLESLQRVADLQPGRILPGHGPEIDQPQEVISWYIAHRRQREAEILEAVQAGAGTVGEVVERVYAEVDSSLFPLAARSVAAHLRKLAAEGRVDFSGETDWSAAVTPGGGAG